MILAEIRFIVKDVKTGEVKLIDISRDLTALEIAKKLVNEPEPLWYKYLPKPND